MKAIAGAAPPGDVTISPSGGAGALTTNAAGRGTSASNAAGNLQYDNSGAAGSATNRSNLFAGAIGRIRTGGQSTLTGYNEDGPVNALDYAGSDIGAKVNAAIAALGTGGGTVFIPSGTYPYSTAIWLSAGNCNITIAGDSSGATKLQPIFSNGDAIGFVDPSTSGPPNCDGGGVRDIQFVAPVSVPNNLNLIHVSNMTNLTFQNVLGWNYSGMNDALVNLDPGISSSGATSTENVHMINVNDYYSYYGLLENAKNYTTTSLNNETWIASHCDTGGSGACIYFQNFAAYGITQHSLYEFNADIVTSGGSILRTNTNPQFLSNNEYHIRAQYAPSSGIGYCFDGPDLGAWIVLGDVQCTGAITASNNSTPVQYTLVPTATSGGAIASIYNVLTNPNLSVQNVTARSHLASNGSAPTVSGGALAIGSSDTFGEISGVSASATLTFHTAFTGTSVACSLTDDGDPFLWYTSSKSTTAVTFNCETIPSGAACGRGSGHVQYQCEGIGAP